MGLRAMTRLTRTFTRGRVVAANDSDAAALVWDKYPGAISVTISGPTPDGQWQYVVEL